MIAGSGPRSLRLLGQASQQKKSDGNFGRQNKPGQLNEGHLVTGKQFFKWGQGEAGKLGLIIAKPGTFRKLQSKQGKLFGQRKTYTSISESQDCAGQEEALDLSDLCPVQGCCVGL